MASYEDLRKLFDNDTMRNRVDVAIVKSANNLLAGTPTTGETDWAAVAFQNPRREGDKAYMAVLASNSELTVEQITGASDAALQVSVDNVVPSLVIANGV